MRKNKIKKYFENAVNPFFILDEEKRINIEEEFYFNYDENFIEILEKILEKNKYILEIGSGFGVLTYFLYNKVINDYYVDISLNMLKKFNNFFKNKRKINMDIEKSAINNQKFDIVISKDISMYVNYNYAIKNIYNMLKNNGYYLLNEKSNKNFIVNIYRKIFKNFQTPVKKFYNSEEIIDLLKQNDFKIIEIKNQYLLESLCFIFNNHFIRYRFPFFIVKKVLYYIDKIILNYFKFLKKYCYATIILAQK